MTLRTLRTVHIFFLAQTAEQGDEEERLKGGRQ
jgi:hypothetical protein